MKNRDEVQERNKMAAVPVRRLLFTMSLPLMLSMVMEAL